MSKQEQIEIEVWKILVEGNGSEGEAVIKFIDLCSLSDFERLKDLKYDADEEARVHSND